MSVQMLRVMAWLERHPAKVFWCVSLPVLAVHALTVPYFIYWQDEAQILDFGRNFLDK